MTLCHLLTANRFGWRKYIQKYNAHGHKDFFIFSCGLCVWNYIIGQRKRWPVTISPDDVLLFIIHLIPNPTALTQPFTDASVTVTPQLLNWTSCHAHIHTCSHTKLLNWTLSPPAPRDVYSHHTGVLCLRCLMLMNLCNKTQQGPQRNGPHYQRYRDSHWCHTVLIGCGHCNHTV